VRGEAPTALTLVEQAGEVGGVRILEAEEAQSAREAGALTDRVWRRRVRPHVHSRRRGGEVATRFR